MDYRTRPARWLLGASAHPGGRALTGHLLDRMDLPRGALVADVACGNGTTLDVVSGRGHLAVGVDLEPGTDRALVADAHALPLASSSYDAVVCECALSTFDAPADALGEMHRVLRPGGTLGLSDVLLRRDLALADVIAAVDRLTNARPLRAYADLVRAAGFEVLATEERPSDAAALVRRLRRRLPLWRTLRQCEQAVRIGTLGYGLVVARKVG